MDLSFFHGLIAESALFALVEFSLVFICVILFFAFLDMGRDELTRRLDLVMPYVKIGAARSTTRHATLSSLSGQRAVSGEPPSIMRLLPRLTLAPGVARLALVAGRAITAVSLGVIAMLVAHHVPALSRSFAIPPLVAAFAATAGWLLPPMVVRWRATQRARAVAAGLPDALDLVVVCLDAGLSLDAALSRVVAELGRAQPALADELAATWADLQILPSRDEALQKMAERVDLPSVRAFVTTLTQTLRYGTPLAQALRTIAAEMRNDALLQLEERANQLPALLTVPLMLFIMPTIFLIIGGPAVLRLIDLVHR